MARIRSVHPGLFTDEAFVSVSMAARVLLPGIWTECDDHGIFEWKPRTLKMKLFPADNVEIDGLLAELVAAGSVRRFEVEGKEYGAAKNFCAWQRPKKPVYVHPCPDEIKDYISFEDDSREFILRKEKWAAENGKCHYCRTAISYYRKRVDSLELDHVIPKIAGGPDDASNLVASCRPCNRAKCAMNASDFRDWLAKKESRSAKTANDDAKSEIPPQMEDGGGSKEEEGGEVLSQTLAPKKKDSSFLNGGEAKAKSSPPRHLARLNNPPRVYIEKGTSEWEQYAADYRETHGHDPPCNSDGGKWFKTLGEATR